MEPERAVWDHVCAVVRDPSALIDDLRKHWDNGSGNLGRRIARLEGDIQKARNETAAVVRQHSRGVIDEITQDQMLAPIATLLAAREAELAKLLKQRELQDASAETEARIRDCFAGYAERLASLDLDGKRALLSRLKVSVIATKERALVTAEIDPSLITIEHTLA